MTPTIDPEVKLFVDRVAEAYARHPSVMTLPYPEGRKVIEEVRRPWRQGGPEMHATEEMTVRLRGGSLKVRIHRPTAERPAPALVYLHGGGYTFFSIDTHDRVMREYAQRAGVVVIGVDYPLSPEAKFPTALHQISDFVLWLEANGSELGIDVDRIAIGGDSAGGNLSMATAVQLRDAGSGRLIKAMVLNYPGLTPYKSEQAIKMFGGKDAILSAEEAEFFWQNYIRTPEDSQNPLANLMLCDPKGLPPALFIVAEVDLLAEQSSAMAGRIMAAGGRAVVKTYEGAVHGFIEAVSVSRLADRALQDTADWLRAIL